MLQGLVLRGLLQELMCERKDLDDDRQTHERSKLLQQLADAGL